MQASKIIPNTVYAIKENDELVRFRVNKVVTVQTRTSARSSPHDYSSEVVGEIIEPDRPKTMKVSPEAILGPYREYAELEARRKAEEEAAVKAKADAEALSDELCDKFYELTGLEPHRDPYKRQFRRDYSGVDIRQEAVEPLLTALRGIARLRAVS